MKLAQEAPPDRYYQEPWPFACPKAVYVLKRESWLDAAKVLKANGSRFGQRTAQVELMHLRNAYYRPPAEPYPYPLDEQPEGGSHVHSH